MIEIIVVIAIATILMGVVSVTLRRGREEQAVRREAQLLTLDIRKAQALAASSAEIQGVVPFGYGVVVSDDPGGGANTQTTLFADLDNDMTYSETAGEFVDSRTFRSEVRAQNAQIFECSMPLCDLGSPPSTITNADTLTFFFCPPNPNTFLYDETTGIGSRGSNCKTAGSTVLPAVRISLVRGAASRTVLVNAVGAVFIEE